jgi:hypothetical protein
MKCACPICADCPIHLPPERYRPATIAEEPTPICQRCRIATAVAEELAGLGTLPGDL